MATTESYTPKLLYLRIYYILLMFTFSSNEQQAEKSYGYFFIFFAVGRRNHLLRVEKNDLREMKYKIYSIEIWSPPYYLRQFLPN